MVRVAIPLLLLLLVVCAAVVSDKPQPPADFTFINRGDVNTLDLQRMSWMQDLRVARLLFEGLTRTDVMTWEFAHVGGVARSWEISDDRRTYTFHLRDDARWSNGDPVTSGDFVYTWRRALLPDTASKYVNFMWFIEGGREFYDWRADALDALAQRTDTSEDSGLRLWDETLITFDQLVGIAAPDDHTFIVTLEQPVPFFLEICAFPVLYPVHAGLLSSYEAPDPVTGRLDSQPGWTKAGVLISNGPFRLDRWRFKRDMRLEVNEHYWDRDSLAIGSILIPSVEEPNATVLAFESGGIDWVSDVTAAYRADIYAKKLAFYDENREEYERLLGEGLDPIEIDRRLPPDPRARIHAFPAFGTYFYNFNCAERLTDGRANPFHDARVRRAFAMTIDKRTIVEEIRRMGEPAAHCLIPPGSLGPDYQSPDGLVCISDAKTQAERDQIAADARALLADAGYPDPGAFMTVEIVFNKDSGHDLIAQAIAKNWQQYLGVPTSLAQKELKVYRNDLINGNFMTSRAGWFGDYGDPTTFLDLSRSDDGNNDRKFQSEEFDRMLDDANAELDPKKRLAMLAEAERVLMEEEIPMVPLYHYVNVQLFDAHHITGISSHPRQEQNLYLVDIFGDGNGPDEPVTLPPRVRTGRRLD